MYEVTIKVAVEADSLEEAKEFAIEYFHSIDKITNDEVRELND